LEKGRGGGLAKGQEATPRTCCSVKHHGVLVYVWNTGLCFEQAVKIVI
jgi:hypothetical protein